MFKEILQDNGKLNKTIDLNLQLLQQETVEKMVIFETKITSLLLTPLRNLWNNSKIKMKK